MRSSQLKQTGILFIGQLLIKISGFIKQLLLAFFLGISADVDLISIVQIIPTIIAGMIAGGAGEILVTQRSKDDYHNSVFTTYFISIVVGLTIAIGTVYALCLPFAADLFHIPTQKMALFQGMSLLIIASKVPSAFVSGLQHLLYAKGKYNFFVLSTLIAEIAGIITIVLLVDSQGILAFAYGMMITPTVNALLFVYAHQLKFGVLFLKKEWLSVKTEIFEIFRKIFSLSLQTLITHLSTFWERTLSLRYLPEGFLSALNYSKSVTELPRMAVLSSVLTTTYIEQTHQKAESEDAFKSYSNKMEMFLSEVAFMFQMGSILFGPLLIILIFKRGAFHSGDVIDTFELFQYLSIGFVPGLMMSFLSRTMYIEGLYKQLFNVTFIKFLLEVGIMTIGISYSMYAIPLALVVSKFFGSITLFSILELKKPGIFNRVAFVRLYAVLLILSIGISFLNHYFIHTIVNKTIFELFLIYVPIALCFFGISIFLLNKRYGSEWRKLLSKKRKSKA